jgi:hypothetical protein
MISLVFIVVANDRWFMIFGQPIDDSMMSGNESLKWKIQLKELFAAEGHIRIKSN